MCLSGVLYVERTPIDTALKSLPLEFVLRSCVSLVELMEEFFAGFLIKFFFFFETFRWSPPEGAGCPGSLSRWNQSFRDCHRGLPDAQVEHDFERRLRLRETAQGKHLAQLQFHGTIVGIRTPTQPESSIKDYSTQVSMSSRRTLYMQQRDDARFRDWYRQLGMKQTIPCPPYRPVIPFFNSLRVDNNNNPLHHDALPAWRLFQNLLLLE